MDANNPAVAQQTALSPADLERIAKDPTVLTETSRKMLAVQMMTMHRRMADPTVPIGQRQSWMDFLAKLGDAMPKQAANGIGVSGPGFSVQIVLTQPTANSTPAQPADVIEADPVAPAALDIDNTSSSDE